MSKPISFEKQLANYLHRKRGDETFRSFAKKLGISPSSLQRLEQAQQNVTLRTVQQITSRLGVSLSEIFTG